MTDPVLVEQEPSPEVRRRLLDRKNHPDWLDAKGAKGVAALGDPASMHSLGYRAATLRFQNSNREPLSPGRLRVRALCFAASSLNQL
jgi:hypothetical protein